MGLRKRVARGARFNFTADFGGGVGWGAGGRGA